MPRPVEALPCGSRSTISTFWRMAASAVARLMAVVVLPTPPFWLATAMMRKPRPFASSIAMATADALQQDDDPARVRRAWNARDVHCPRFLGFRQFPLQADPLVEDAHASRRQKRPC